MAVPYVQAPLKAPTAMPPGGPPLAKYPTAIPYSLFASALNPMAMLERPRASVPTPIAIEPSLPSALLPTPRATETLPLAVLWDPIAVDWGPLALLDRPIATESELEALA